MAEDSPLTVLFCDLVGSTHLSSQLDPEDWRDIVRAYQQVSATVLQRRGGYIAQYQGDGLVVYFGYPQPHAGDVVEAVEAGLEIVVAVDKLNEQLQHEYGVTLAVRVGVHTGRAVFGVFGEEGHTEQLAVGETPTIAAGIQDYAEPNTVVVSGPTLKSLPDTFAWRDLGRQVIKGVADRVQVAQVQVTRAGLPHQAATAERQQKEERPDEAERRQLTVMFCQLAGAAELAARLSPEAILNIVQDYQTTSVEVISQYDGHIAQYLDTGLLVYFGYPTAHEDDAPRAVRAALAILEATQLLNARVHAEQRVEVALRLGIHTGLVVAGEVGGGSRTEQLAMGETPNIAARVQGAAAPGTVAISPTTAQLVTGYFEWEELGQHTLKGVPAPMLLRRVVAESAARSRLDVAGRSGVLVGRETETSLLADRWAKSQTGQGQVILVSGEAGIGKSRLVEALCEQAQGEGATLLRLRCSSYYQNSAFYPLIELLQGWLGFVREDSPDTRLSKLTQKLEAYQFSEVATVSLFAQLLSLSPPHGYPPLTGTPQHQRQKLQAALVTWMSEEASRQVTLVVWEDLHWIDPSSLEVLSLLIEQLTHIRLCVILTARPEFVVPWDTQPCLTAVELQRLDAAQVVDIVANVTAGRQLPAELLDQIVTKTDGIPLFVEELTKMLVESDVLRAINGHYELSGPLSTLAIPLTLQDSLMARLDRLGPAKAVAQVSAVIGREFSYELLQAIRPEGETGLVEALRQLVEAELVSEQASPPHASYQFAHVLIQNTAYESLLRRTRQRHHQQIATVLEADFPDIVESQPELVAHHYTEARLAGQAVPYWQQAGQRANQRSANAEAISHLTKGLALLKTLPDTSEYVHQELTLQVTLGTPLQATKGYSAPEVEQVYTRARDLCRQLGETPQLFPVLWGLAGVAFIRGEMPQAREFAEQCLTLAQQTQDSTMLVNAHNNALGQVLYFMGEVSLAQQHFEQGLALYDPQQHNPRLSGFVQDPGVAGHTFFSYILWRLGYPDQALQSVDKTLSLAQELSHPLSQVYALNTETIQYMNRREAPQVQERAEALGALCEKHGFPFFSSAAMGYQGWALAEQGQAEEGIALLRECIAAKQAIGAEAARPGWLSRLAEALWKGGQVEEGLKALAEALERVNRTGERIDEAELYRLKGELTLGLESKGQRARGTEQNEAEACFRKAIGIARQQKEKSLELRAVTSLARLWHQQEKTTEAYQLLAEIYDWFTEGFDTPDLKDTKALLTELAEDRSQKGISR